MNLIRIERTSISVAACRWSSGSRQVTCALRGLGCWVWCSHFCKKRVNRNVRTRAVTRERVMSTGPVPVSLAGWVQTVVCEVVHGVMRGPTTRPPTTLRMPRQNVRIEVYVIGQLGIVSVWMASQDVPVNTWHATSIATTMANVLVCDDSRRPSTTTRASSLPTNQFGMQIRSMGAFATRRIQQRLIVAYASVHLGTIH